MPTRYSTDPFKVYYVKDPTSGTKRWLTDKTEAHAIAEELARARGAKVADVLLESRTYFLFEYAPGSKRGRRVNTGEETLFLAREWARRRMRDRRGPVRTGSKDLAEAVAEWLEELEVRGLRPKSLLDYRVQTRFWLEHFAGKTVAEVTRQGLIDFFKSRRVMRGKADKGKPRKRPSARLLNLNLVLLRAFAKWCLDEDRGYLEKDPTRGIERRAEERKEPRALSPEEVQCLLKACREPFGVVVTREGFRPYAAEKAFEPPKYLEAAVTCAVTSLLRLGNVLGLLWGDIDFERGEIRVPAERVKTRAELVIPLASSLRRILLELPKGGADVSVFPVKEIKRSFAGAVKRAGLRGVTFHCLRKTGATHCLRSGVPFEVVQRLGGWSTGGNVLLDSYRRIDVDDLRKAVEALDRLVAGERATVSNAAAVEEAPRDAMASLRTVDLSTQRA